VLLSKIHGTVSVMEAPTTPRPGCFFLFGHYSVLSLIDGIVTPGDLDQTGDRVLD
jgi:hypothetical protein